MIRVEHDREVLGEQHTDLIAPQLIGDRSLRIAVPAPDVYRADEQIDGLPITVVGHPKVIKSPLGKAIQFNGVDDALFIPEHPLAGAGIFTFEAIFRPERGGAVEQRWFHLAEQDPKTGKDTDTRVLFEIRVIGDQWCLDAFLHTPTADKALLFRDQLHPLDVWHHVAMVYDGKEYRHFVDGQLQGSDMVALSPIGPGKTSIGVRMNKVDYFKGAIRTARITKRSLPVSEFLLAK